MRFHLLLAVGLVAVSGALAAEPDKASSGGAVAASIYNGPATRVSMWIWTNKYTYSPGESATLRWTVKTSNDLYPYVVIAYRQNNQTGAKAYLPGNSEAVTDINGNSLEQGLQAAQLTDQTKAVLATVALPSEPGMHTFVVQLRDYTGTRVLKASYMKIGVVTAETTLAGEITSNRTLTNNTKWNLSGKVTVKNNATLTVEPGTFVFGLPGGSPPSVLVITRNGRLVADGTRSRPIVFTSNQPFGQRKRGDWGGVLILGKAKINVGANQTSGICPASGCSNAAGTFFVEGLVADDDGLYGGDDDTHDCGSTQYTRIEYSGVQLTPNNETNSFTWGACGTKTVAHHLQAHYGGDDAFEWFGGSMNAKYLVGGLSADDYVDYQLGYTGKIQYGISYQSPDQNGNRGIEGDNSEYDQGAREPFSNPTMYNLTFIGSGVISPDTEGAVPGIFLRRNTRGTFNNMVVTNFFGDAVAFNDAPTQVQADAGNIKMNGILAWNNNKVNNGANTIVGQYPGNGGYNALYAQGQKGNGAGKNFVVSDPMLSRPFEFSDPDFAARFGSPVFRAGWVQPPDDGFFDQSATFIGGIGDEDWTKEWTNFLVETDIAP